MRSLRSAYFCAVFALGCAARPPLLVPQSAQPPRRPYPGGAHSASTPAATPSAEASATPSALSQPPVLTTFGSAPFADSGPLLVERVSPDGRWLTLCQARRDSTGDGQVSVSVGPRGELLGDDVRRYLLTPGEEIAHEGFMGMDPSGRFALLMQHGALVLWDSQQRKSLDLSALGADSRLSAESFAELRSVAFDATGEHLLYTRTGDGGQRLIIRTLSDDTERALDAGPGPIWRASFAPSGTFLVVEVISTDSNKNGKADFPAPLLAAPRACSAGPGQFHAWSERGDKPETVLVPLTGGAPIHEPALLMPVRDALLLRDDTGTLLLQKRGKKRVLEPAACRGRIVHADAERELFIVGCVQPKKTGRVSLELVTPGGRKPLDLELSSVEYDRELSDGSRLVALYPGAESVLFDADRREVSRLQPGDSVLATLGARALIRRGNGLLSYDAETHTEQALPGVLDKNPEILVSQPFVFVSPLLVKLDSASVVAETTQRPLALSNSGQLLMSDSEPQSSGLARGPLHWATAPFGASPARSAK